MRNELYFLRLCDLIEQQGQLEQASEGGGLMKQKQTKIVSLNPNDKGWKLVTIVTGTFLLYKVFVPLPHLLIWFWKLYWSGRINSQGVTFLGLIFGAVSVLGAVACVCVVKSLQWLVQLRRSRQCFALSTLAESQHLSAKELAEGLRSRGVRPRFVVDGEPRYAREDLGDVATLLRPSQSSEELLLPLEFDRNIAPQTLLHPVEWKENSSDQPEPLESKLG